MHNLNKLVYRSDNLSFTVKIDLYYGTHALSKQIVTEVVCRTKFELSNGNIHIILILEKPFFFLLPSNNHQGKCARGLAQWL